MIISKENYPQDMRKCIQNQLLPSALADDASNRQFSRVLAHHSAKAGPDNNSYPSVETDGNH